MKAKVILTTIAAALCVGCGDQPVQESVKDKPVDPVAKPPVENSSDVKPAESVVETPVQQSSELKPSELLTPTIQPVEWKTATRGNWDMATRGNTEQIEQLLAEGMDVDVTDKEGMTALYRAAHNDQKETVSLLLDKGANVNIRDRWGNTPLDITLNDDIANLLRKHGGKTGKELKAEGK